MCIGISVGSIYGSILPHHLLQKQEEAQSNNLVSTADIDNEAVIKLVSDAVMGILTRLQSEYCIAIAVFMGENLYDFLILMVSRNIYDFGFHGLSMELRLLILLYRVERR